MKYKAQWKHRWKSVAAALLLAVSITGCSGVPSTSNVKETPGYTLPQSMIIVATERNRYQQIYTSDLWNVTLNNGMTFQIYLLDQVQTFLQNMKTMSLLAKDQDITLTGSEKDRLRRLSETYYEGLSQDDIAYMGIDLDDVITMYQEYYLANKVVGELTKELNLEVSDSEAKVITIQQLAVSDRDTANQLYEQAAAEGSDFAAIAQAWRIPPLKMPPSTWLPAKSVRSSSPRASSTSSNASATTTRKPRQKERPRFTQSVKTRSSNRYTTSSRQTTKSTSPMICGKPSHFHRMTRPQPPISSSYTRRNFTDSQET